MLYVVLVNVTEWIHMHMVCAWNIYNGMRTYKCGMRNGNVYAYEKYEYVNTYDFMT